MNYGANTEYGSKDGRKETVLIMDLAATFTRAKLTGTQGLDVLRGTVALLEEAKENNRQGGMFAAIQSMYDHPDLPVPIIEQVLLHVMQYTFFRSNAIGDLNRAIRFVTDTAPDLTQPWRDVVRQVMAAKAQHKSHTMASMKAVKEAYGEDDDTAEGDGDDL